MSSYGRFKTTFPEIKSKQVKVVWLPPSSSILRDILAAVPGSGSLVDALRFVLDDLLFRQQFYSVRIFSLALDVCGLWSVVRPVVSGSKSEVESEQR